MVTPTVTPTTPRGLVVVTGGSGYIAGYCIAQLLNEGWRVGTTVRNLGRAEEVRATIGKVEANAAAIEFAAADLNSDAGWANAVAGADYVLHVASPVPTVDNTASPRDHSRYRQKPSGAGVGVGCGFSGRWRIDRSIDTLRAS